MDPHAFGLEVFGPRFHVARDLLVANFAIPCNIVLRHASNLEVV